MACSGGDCGQRSDFRGNVGMQEICDPCLADAWNHRVLIWRSLPEDDNVPADVVCVKLSTWPSPIDDQLQSCTTTGVAAIAEGDLRDCRQPGGERCRQDAASSSWAASSDAVGRCSARWLSSS